MVLREGNGIGQRITVLRVVKNDSFFMGYAQRRLIGVQAKISNVDFFSENFTIERWWVSEKNGGSPTSFWREHARKNT